MMTDHARVAKETVCKCVSVTNYISVPMMFWVQSQYITIYFYNKCNSQNKKSEIFAIVFG